MKQLTENQDKVNSSLYLDETDSKGVPLLRRIEKYPDLPEDKFIPIEYIHSGKDIPNNYYINKKGEVKNIKNNYVLKMSKGNHGYFSYILGKKNSSILVHRLVASTFLINPNIEIYSAVNHIDHNPENNNLSNLEWLTICENNNKSNGKLSKYRSDTYMQYIALDDGVELFSISREYSNGYNPDCITTSIKNKCRYKGYYWKKSDITKKEKVLKLVGYSGNINDYEWYEHWKYPELYVCKEGFVKRFGRVICSLENHGYLYTNLLGKSTPIHRIIVEYLENRELAENEVIDHINGIKTDNSFTNLRVTDQKGNMNNINTLIKISKKFILIDLYGDLIKYDITRNIREVLETNNDSSGILNSKFHKGKNKDEFYFCLEPNELDKFYNIVSELIYIISASTGEIVKVPRSLHSIWKNKMFSLTRNNVEKYFKEGLDNIKGYKLIRGKEAIDLLRSTGHLTAEKFIKDQIKLNNKNDE